MKKEYAEKILEAVDARLNETAELREVAEILAAGFQMNDEKNGEAAMRVMIHFLDHLEEELDRMHSRIDALDLEEAKERKSAEGEEF